MADVRIAGGQGFYGDTPAAGDALLADGIDYLCLEALAELTLAILQKDRQRDESRGYTRDLPAYLERALPAVISGRTKVITNAGGINPRAAARVAIETARRAGGHGLKVATVVGDDLTGRLDTLRRDHGQAFAHNDTGAPFTEFAGPARFAAAYLGARPVAEALAAGADIVITGRVADASLFLAPLVHEHGWAWNDWDRLASGILVGHLLECSGQSVGGNYSGEWWTIPHPWDLPYPIAEVSVDGTAVITKPAASGGRVSFDTLRHQLLYEVHDPTRYLSPDVVADFTSAR
ncbi:MAG: acyclic terpene utilization AtuA family protein, partial [Actinomycetota bacterium]